MKERISFIVIFVMFPLFNQAGANVILCLVVACHLLLIKLGIWWTDERESKSISLAVVEDLTVEVSVSIVSFCPAFANEFHFWQDHLERVHFFGRAGNAATTAVQVIAATFIVDDGPVTSIIIQIE
jgi:hypothetical protein